VGGNTRQSTRIDADQGTGCAQTWFTNYESPQEYMSWQEPVLRRYGSLGGDGAVERMKAPSKSPTTEAAA
jgi:hypothetical protein